MNKHVLYYEDIKFLSIKEMKSVIDGFEGIKLSELKVKDLSYCEGLPLKSSCGVYLFRENKQIFYVGKVTSMSFTERIPKHFDLRPKAWFNRLLELLCKNHLKLEWNNINIKEASKYAFENLDLVIIPFQIREGIENFEKLLRASANPLNKFKNLKVKDENVIVEVYK